MTYLTIKQTDAVILYFQSKLQDKMKRHGYTYLDATQVREDIESIIDGKVGAEYMENL